MSTNVAGVVGVNETRTCDAFSWVTDWVKSVAAVAGMAQARTISRTRDTARTSLAGEGARFMQRSKPNDEIKSIVFGCRARRAGGGCVSARSIHRKNHQLAVRTIIPPRPTASHRVRGGPGSRDRAASLRRLRDLDQAAGRDLVDEAVQRDRLRDQRMAADPLDIDDHARGEVLDREP